VQANPLPWVAKTLKKEPKPNQKWLSIAAKKLCYKFNIQVYINGLRDLKQSQANIFSHLSLDIHGLCSMALRTSNYKSSPVSVRYSSCLT